jgi:cellulose synthase/poly-beta-1,6-N-acetylglucosamine synthase-like glycosyltransferase
MNMNSSDITINFPKVSIIIPCKHIDSYTKQCIQHCKNLDYPDFEIIVLPDENGERLEDVKIISTGNVSPGKKRNIGVENSSGEILAFIDNDAYPKKDWLKNAVRYFNNDEIAAVGGPGITPEEDSDMQKVSGYILSSFLVGNLSNRFKESKAYESDDIHSCNFIARKEVVEKVRWNEKYWPGEDTLMCLGIRRLGMKMLETPDVVVYHHRKPVFIPHLKQVSRFGLHRGFFAKKFPENSRRFTYFIPSLLILYFIAGGVLSIFNQTVRTFYIVSLLAYLVLALIAALHAGGREFESPRAH